MRTAPCKDCGKRFPGCHADCPDYRGFREELDKAAEVREKAVAGCPALCSRVVKQIWKEMKRR